MKKGSKLETCIEKELESIYKIQKEIILLDRTGAFVQWDQQTCMPEAGEDDCAERVALLKKLYHERFTSIELRNSVNYLLKPENFEKLNEKDQIVVKRLYKDIEKKVKLPTEFVEEKSKAERKSYAAWEKAKKQNNFEVFRPHLEKIFEFKKEEAKLISLPGHPYNSLLDHFEEGMTVDKLGEVFSFLSKELTKLLKKIQSSDMYKKQNEKLFEQKFEQESQEKVCELLIKLMNLPEKESRLDISMHPFTTTIGDKDVRITTRYTANPLESLRSTLHEAGHALYCLGLPEEYSHTVIGYESPSLGIDESQSRFWENMIGRSESFWKYFYPLYKGIFMKQLKDTSFKDWLKIVNLVKPSFIRVEADELTYCQHVILRYEIEKDMIEGSIAVKDLPKIWNKKFEEKLGIKPENDKEGVLQDVHWSEGYIGYFPTYVIGTIYAAQLYNQLVKENPDVEKEIEKGKLSNILSWLREKVHKHGRTLMADEVITKACGEGLNPEAYIKYLDDKYSKTYKA